MNRYRAVGATGIYFLDEPIDASGGSKRPRALKRYRLLLGASNWCPVRFHPP